MLVQKQHMTVKLSLPSSVSIKKEKSTVSLSIRIEQTKNQPTRLKRGDVHFVAQKIIK